MGAEEKFSISKRLKSFTYAFNGLKIVISEEHNSRIHIVAAIVVIIAAILLGLETYEWLAIIFSIGFVITIEILNTAIENLANFLTTENDEWIGRIKDISAAAVFISAITAFAIGLFIFVPKVIELFSYSK